MNTTKKIGIAFAAIIFGIMVSPIMPLSEAETVKKTETFVEDISKSNVVKTVKIVGLDYVSFAPNTINIAKEDTIIFLNVDGSNGGTDHTVTSAKIGTMEYDGTFDSGIIRVGGTFKVTFDNSGDYEYFDSLNPTVSGRISVR